MFCELCKEFTWRIEARLVKQSVKEFVGHFVGKAECAYVICKQRDFCLSDVVADF